MNSIIHVTENAVARIHELQKSNNGFFYIAVKESGCNGFKYVVEMLPALNPDSDEEIKIGDISIYMDKQSIKFLQGMQLDCISKDMGQWQWEFKNPNAKGHCGCGESFSI